jgi:CHAT domain-containing protein
LWAVNDKKTAGLMARFYRGLEAGQSPTDALRTVQLEMIRAGKAPLYWAPFVLIGQS